MMSNPEIRRIASRAAANLVAVVAISAIFGLKAYIDQYAPPAPVSRAAAVEIAYAPPALAGAPAE